MGSIEACKSSAVVAHCPSIGVVMAYVKEPHARRASLIQTQDVLALAAGRAPCVVRRYN